MRNKLLVLLVLLCACAVVWANAVGTTSTSTVDRRNQEPLMMPVWSEVITYTFATTDATLTTVSIPINGILQKITIDSTNASGSITAFAILDNEDVTIFSDTTLADNTEFTYSVHEPLTGTIDVNVTPADPGGAYVVTVTLRGI